MLSAVPSQYTREEGLSTSTVDATLVLRSFVEDTLPGAEHRTPAERLAILKKCVVWASVFSRQADMQVLPSPEGQWACSVSAEATSIIRRYFEGKIETLTTFPPELFKPVRIFYDADDSLKKPDPVVLGTLWHEVGHARFTDFRLFFEGQKIAQSEGYLPSSWALMANCLEDPWVNNRVMELTDVSREQIMALYRHDLDEMVKKAPEAPLSFQWGLNVIHYWFTGQPIPGIDARAQQAFDQLLPHINEYFEEKDPARNYLRLKEKIWPVFKTLESQAVESEKGKELKRRVIRVVMAPPGGGGGGMPGKGAQGDGDEITIVVGGDGGGSGDLDEELKDLLGDLSEKEREALKKAIEKAAEEMRRKSSPHAADHASLEMPDFDIDTSAPHLRATIDRLSRNLSAASQQALETSARAAIDRSQGSALNSSLPSGMQARYDAKSGQMQMEPSQGPSEDKAREIEKRMSELAERLESEVKRAADDLSRSQHPPSDDEIKANIKKAMREVDFANAGFRPEEQAAYERFKALEHAMERETRDMIRRLQPILPKKYETTPDDGYRSGSKINITRLIRREPVGLIDFHQRKKVTPGVDPKLFVELIIDRSGSMFPDKMPEALKTAIFWGRVCDAFGIPFAIKFFDHTFCRVKDYDQPYHDRKHRVKPNLVLLSEAIGGSTNMGAPLSVAFEEMKEARQRYPDSMGAVFIISDSGANTGLTGEPLRALIRRMQEEFLVGAFVLSEHEQDRRMNRYYFGEENVVAPEHFSDLPRESFSILRKTIINFARKYS